MNWGMKMTNQMPNNQNEMMLDDLFDLAREVQVAPSDDLMARIIADADEIQTMPSALPKAAPVSIIGGLMDLIGGWKALGGLATATATGLWIGISPPTAFEDFTTDYYTTAASDISDAGIDSLLGFDTLILEEGA